MIQFLTYLYAVVPIVVIIGWIPQIVAIFRNPRSARGMSIGTWATWTVSGLVGTLYGVFVLGDFLVTLTFLANFIGQATILSFAIWARVKNIPLEE
jgi:uncharacterized membrane protein HdeD (DUF308 family)